MERNQIYELTNPQKGIWLTEQYFQNTAINNICGSLTIKQDINLNLLNTAINIFIQNNDSFKLRFIQDKSNLYQYFTQDENIQFEILKIKKDNQIEEYAKKMVDIPFDLLHSRVFDFKLFKLSSGYGGFIVNVHHIISDAATFSFIATEIVQIYSKLLKNETPPTKNYSYIDYIRSEKEYLKSSRFEKDKNYWREVLTPLPEVATVFSPNSPKTTTNNRANRMEFILSHHIIKKIKNYCKQRGITLFHFLIGVYAIYFGKTNHMEQFNFGTPILNRTNFAEKHTSGMFINTSLIKIDMSENKTFTEFAQDIAKYTITMLRHQKYNYQQILEDVRKQDQSISELYDIGLSYQITQATDSSLEIPYSTKWYGTNYIGNILDIHFHDNDSTGNLLMEYDYQIERLTKEEISNIHDRILTIISQILENKNIFIYNIDIVTKEEKNQILNQFQPSKEKFPKERTLIELFHMQVMKNPKQIAVEFQNQKITYQELDQKSNQLARFLIETYSIKPRSIISVCMDRKIDLVIAILAILKTGSSYLPIHPDYPIDRIKYILNDSKSKLILTDKEKELPNQVIFSKIVLEPFSDSKINPLMTSQDLAYVIYTSGSTGNPKGVMLKHCNLVNFIYSFNHVFKHKFGKEDKCLSITNISFDVSVCELFTPLILGATLVLYEENTLTNLKLLVNTITQNKITFLYIPPNILQTIYEELFKEKEKVHIKKLLVGVESIKNSTLNQYYNIQPEIEIINGYGPTETTICCSFYPFQKTPKQKDDEIVPIGKPLANNEILILDQNLQIQPIHIPGELYVSGENVSKGYIGNQELTKHSFLKINNKIYYKTGDLGYYDDKGNIHFLGRNDSQIKIRGHRVELGEITNNLKKIDWVENAYSMMMDHNHKSVICSYVVLKQKTENASSKIKEELKKYLPYYMIPTYIIPIPKMPINLSGKIDKSKLPEVEEKNFSTVMVLPVNDTEEFLQKVFMEILEVNKISTEENYFDLGADSLTCIKLIAEIENRFKIDLKITDLFENNTIKNLAKKINQKRGKQNKEPIKPCIQKESYELSSAQKRVYYGSYILDNQSVSYNLPGGIFMDKIPDISKLERCFQTLIQRHEILRTYFEIEDGKPMQKIAPKVPFSIEVVNLEKQEIDTYFHKFVKPFDLSKAPILRVCLVKLVNQTSLLLFDTHHIIMDGTSMQILIQELGKLYQGEKLGKIQLTYKDYSEWENFRLSNNQFKRSKQFWLKQFSEEIPVLNLPYKHPRPAKKSFKGAKIYKKLNETLSNKILAISRKMEVTPYMFLLTSYSILLSKYADQDTIVIGSPSVARENKEISSMIGMFVNTLPLKISLNQNDTFRELLQNVKELCLDCFEHQAYPFNEIVKDLKVSRDISRNPLFDVLFTYQNEGNPEMNLPEIKTKYYIPDSKIAKFDLSLEVVPQSHQFHLNFEYSTSLFTHPFIEDLANHYSKILEQVVDNLELKISEIDMLSQKEKNKILIEFNQTKMDYPKEKSLVDLFQIQVKKNKSHIAVQKGERKITYQELEEKSNTIALEILKNKNISPKSIIGVYMNKSIELLITIWGILKSGNTYMPMYIGYPEERLNYMLENSKSPLVITNQPNTSFKVPTQKVRDFKKIENTQFMLFPEIKPEDTAYVIYTSGSTGRPKGVKITHQCLNNYIHSFYQLFKNISYEDKFLSSTNISFDVSIWELFLSILKGATLVLYEEEIITDVVKYTNAIVQNEITTLYIPPNILEEVYHILKTKADLKINKLLVGVEPIKRQTLNQYYKLNPDIKIINGYGPTETTICSTALEYENAKKQDKIVSIGKPIGNTKIYIVDKNQNIVPIGVPGELWISGDGVGQGYIANETENKKNFIENKFDTNSSKIYRTGDLAKWNSNGTISYIARKDNQVKISGYRIELQEIDKTMIKYPYISKSCSQVYKTQNKTYLVTYFTAGKTIDIADLTQFLQSKLAFYMIPNRLIRLESFPLTVNGKIDTKKLPKPIVQGQTNYSKPETELEKTLCKIWQNLFGIQKIGIQDNFFALGGDSLSAIKFQVEAFNRNLNITYADIFACPTIKLLAKKAQNAHPVEEKKEQDIDVSKINPLLAYNDIKNIPKKIKRNPIGNVLLTGATGFLGSHIIDNYFSSNPQGAMYCIVREKNRKTPEQRLKETLNFYFGSKYDTYLGEKLFVLKGDTSQENLGLDNDTYTKLANVVDIVINAAALVKHYGDYNKFYAINVTGTKNLIEFCEKSKKKLYHISTTSVSGIGISDSHLKGSKEITHFSEKDFYQNQNLDNTYLQTKFEAERLILEEIANQKLEATIFRVGNIQNRYLDGKFQINSDENGFVNRMKAILKLGVIQNEFKKHATEFAPVDFCANAIISLIQSNPKFTVFHIFNTNLVSFTDLVKYINYLDIPINFVSNQEFSRKVSSFLKNPVLRNEMNGIVTDLDSEKKLKIVSNILIDANFTTCYLEKIGFTWPEINQEYIGKYINYFRQIHFFN